MLKYCDAGKTKAVCAFFNQKQPELFSTYSPVIRQKLSLQSLEGFIEFFQLEATVDDKQKINSAKSHDKILRSIVFEPLSFDLKFDFKYETLPEPSTRKIAFFSIYDFVTKPLQATAAVFDFSLSFVWNLLIDIGLSAVVIPKKVFFPTRCDSWSEEFDKLRSKIPLVCKAINLVIRPIRFILEEVVGGIVGFIPAAIGALFTKAPAPSAFAPSVPEEEPLNIPEEKPRSLIAKNLVGETAAVKNKTTFYYNSLRKKQSTETNNSANVSSNSKVTNKKN
jgi:hypothetical protein